MDFVLIFQKDLLKRKPVMLNGNNCDVEAWGNYDASRVAIWKRYYDTLQLKSPGILFYTGTFCR